MKSRLGGAESVSGAKRATNVVLRPAALMLLGISFFNAAAVNADPLERLSGKVVAHRAGKAVRSPAGIATKTYSIGRTALEPTVGIDPAGDIFYAAGGWTDTPGLRTGGSTEVMRSSDSGKTWTAVTPRVLDQNHQRVSLDPYVFVDNTETESRVFTIDLTVACSYMSFTDDQGETWTTNPLACGRPVNDHQTLFGGPPVTSPTVGYPHVLYYCWNDVATSSCSKSLDGGISFSPTGAPAATNCGGLHGHGRVGPDGTVYLPRHLCGEPVLLISEDEGRTWKTVTVSQKMASGAQDPTVAVDEKGNLYYLWVAADDRLPYLSTSRDGGKTWSDAIVAGPPTLDEANLPSIAAAGVGKIALVYYGSSNSPWPRCRENCSSDDYARTTWDGYVTVSADALSERPLFISALVNPPGDPLVRQVCGPGRCHNVMDFIDVEIGRDGVAYGAFVDSCMPEPDPGCTSENPVNASAAGGGYEGLVAKIVGAPRLR